MKEVADRAVSIGFDVVTRATRHTLTMWRGSTSPSTPRWRASACDSPIRCGLGRHVPARKACSKVAVTEISGGRMSPWLVSTVEPGVTIGVLPPWASSPTSPTAGSGSARGGRRGSGITPVLAIMAEILAADEATSVDLLLANRTRDSAVLRDEVTALVESSGHRLRVIDVLSREQVRGVRHARIDADLLDQVWGGEGVRHRGWWLCGPEGLLQTAETWIGGATWTPLEVHRERFTRTGPVDPRPDPRSRGLSGSGLSRGRSARR